MALRDITRAQVLAAIEEYDALGQDEFLTRYGFDRSRSCLLIHDGKPYDSKAIVGAAHGVGSGKRPLSAGDFSGGQATVGRLLRRLGFIIEISGDADTAELIRRITSLTVNRSSGRPALYQPITLLWAIGRAFRGEPRMESWDITHRQVAELLERHGRGTRPRPDYPIAALRRAELWELDADGDRVPNAHGDTELRRWFDTHQPRSGLVAWADDLMRNSRHARMSAVGAILGTFRAVLIRSGGRCENPGCTGQAEDLTDSGDPILEIDHIRDLAQGGADDPAQMIALCPNCHAIKTRGRTREQLREVLLATARQRHDALR